MVDEKMFRSLMRKAKTKQSNEPTRADYWRGFQKGLQRLYHGENFGTPEEHEKWLNCAEGEYRKELQEGYRDGFY